MGQGSSSTTGRTSNTTNEHEDLPLQGKVKVVLFGDIGVGKSVNHINKLTSRCNHIEICP